ncbi:phosphogluconate dehydrogenase C-terminal domain-containing protein [Bradyrhizobium prioriisuperbiae]|uniref:phosphogluconate dehydrogenase C-terminal domain-containing protein n=1 Tax=Bradyrhizobium prioriisuperbiae TaxID=2854389 RepID=UPI0028E1C008|nr:phosphogluconate dehydrogenase C-terminal domain-containing protein [Bradyrhizobium prioritasuperba]
MTKIALLGAGGKMGVRLATNIVRSNYELIPVEVSDEGRQRLHDALGLTCSSLDTALAAADVVILAIPDRSIGKVAHEIINKVKSGTAIIMLDAAAPHAGELPERADISYFVTHPCHPPVFNDETTPDAKADFFGGTSAKQHIVCALMQGPDEHYTLCEAIARVFYGPVMRSHRCTVEHIAIMEPALSETVAITLCLAIKEATDEAVRRGVPEQAATDFVLGHIAIGLSIAFGVNPGGKFSDGALHAIALAKPEIFRDGWLERIFNPAAVKQSVIDICNPKAA